MKLQSLVSLRSSRLCQLASVLLSIATMPLGYAEPTLFERESKEIMIAPENASDFGLHGLADQELRSSDDQPIGKIVDLVIDADSGRAAYAVVAVGGFFGFGSKLYVVPTMALRPSVAGPDFTVAMAKGKLEQVPQVSKDDFEADHLTLPLQDRLLLEALFSRSLATGDSLSSAFPPVTRPIRASELQRKVVASGGRRVGKIEDVICDFDHGCVAKALLRPNPDFTGSNRAFLVPIARLSIESEQQDPILTMLRPEDFQHAVVAQMPQ